MATRPSRASAGGTGRRGTVARVRRNFSLLVAAAVVAVGVLSQALKAPSGPATAAVVAVSGLAAIASVSLAGRILAVTTAHRRHATPRRWIRRH